MPMFIMHRDRVIHSLSGHILKFAKGEPLYVPPPAVREVMAAGGVPVDNDELPQDAETDANAKVEPAEANDPAKRKEAILAAFKLLQERNERGDFDASGKPAPKMVSSITGFTVDAKERNAVWTEYMEGDA